MKNKRDGVREGDDVAGEEETAMVRGYRSFQQKQSSTRHCHGLFLLAFLLSH